jgi:putative DNA primase/helicase
LPPVAPFDPDFLPDAIFPWVMDIANRTQCQPDNVAVAAMTALGAVIGRRVGIKPQMNTDWVEVPNIWGAAIGRPGLMKSGAQHAGVGPLHRLEGEAARKNAAALQAYEAELEEYKIRREVNKQFRKVALKGGTKQSLELGAEPISPVDTR